jgi:hypothetical protein
MRFGRSSRRNVRTDRVILSAIVTTMAFAAFSRTLLPGVDLGDTGGFQAAVLWPEISARQAYPLYYGLASPFVHLLSPANPARGLNLFSAVWGAVASGLLAWLVATITRSRIGGAVAGLLLAFSYTFWTQAIIAEVYTLHLALVSVILIGLHAWERKRTNARLVLLCALYALAFGNHLSTILLFVPLVAFLAAADERPQRLLHPRVIGSGLLIAALGALQYTPNMLALWSDIDSPHAWTERLAQFWFDVTKADWRATMILGVPPGNLTDRLAMWFWDARQQFGIIGLGIAVFGAIALWWRSRPWAVFLWTAYAINTLFALTYNVGDTHVFFLPSHFFTAFAAGVGAAVLVTRARQSWERQSWGPQSWGPAFLGAEARRGPSGEGGSAKVAAGAVAQALVVTLLLALVVWRGWDTWPFVDRHEDRRGEQLTSRLLLGIDDHQAVLISRMNWDQENALLYAGRYLQPNAPWVRLYEVMPHLPYLVRDNFSIGRDLVLTADAAARVAGAFGEVFPIVEDPASATRTLSEIAGDIPRGSPYVLTLLTPLRDYHYDADDVNAAIRELVGHNLISDKAYQAIAGLAGEKLLMDLDSDRPFDRNLAIRGDVFRIRMDAWLPTDTFRRASFGHVVLNRQPILLIERGASLVWLGNDGQPHVAYAGGLYAPQPRFRIPVPTSRLALTGVDAGFSLQAWVPASACRRGCRLQPAQTSGYP